MAKSATKKTETKNTETKKTVTKTSKPKKEVVAVVLEQATPKSPFVGNAGNVDTF